MTKIYYFGLTLLLASNLCWSAESDSSQRLETVREEIKLLNQDLSQKKADKEALYQQLKQQSKEASAISRQLRNTEQQVAKQKQKLAELQQELGSKKSQYDLQLEALYNQIRSAYIHAQPTYLKVLLNQQNVSSISRNTTYYQYFHQARQEQLTTINETLRTLNTEQQQLFASQKELESLFTQQQQQQLALQKQNLDRKQTITLLEQTIANQGNQLTALKSEEDTLQNLLNKLATQPKHEAVKPSHPALKPSGPFSRQTGKLLWPVEGKLLAHYGSSRNLGKLKWQGIVIGSPTGNEVRSTAAGRVVFADWLRGFGLLIIVDHGEQYMTLYGNNETLLKEAGDTVVAGEIIAQSGEQGMRGLAGLYFEIRHRGNPTNPIKWLQKKG